MKRILYLSLVLMMAVSLMACGKQEAMPQIPAAEEAPSWAGQFAVGYGRVDVTPNYSVGMQGYGDLRMSIGVLSKLYITCVAMTDESENTVLLYTYDAKSVNQKNTTDMREAIAQATGVPLDNIMISSTHSHSTPVQEEPFLSFVKECAVKAAREALADREVATMEYGFAEIENMTFVRHYITSTGVVVGDNFAPEGAGKWLKHTTEADKEMRVVRVNREGKKPIVMVNWLGHATIASSSWTEFGKLHRDYLTSDYVGTCREYVEEQLDCHFALYMGASGNINVTGALAGEQQKTTVYKYGQELGQYVLSVLENMTPGTTADVTTAVTQFDGAVNTFDIFAVGTGSLGVVVAPFEMFDTTSMAIREKSPYDVTFVLTQANGTNGYMPTENCYDYVGCYEVSDKFRRGDAERIVDIYVSLLEQTKS